jgi:AraC-like DNA-binding protein
MQAVELIDQQYFSSQYHYMAPAPDLAEHVVCYWMLDLRNPALQQAEFREILLANMCSSLILNFGAPFEMYDTLEGHLHTSAKSELIGYRPTPVAYRHLFNNHLVGIKFRPASLNYLFHVKGEDINGKALAATDVLQHINSLESAVYEAVNPEAVKVLLDGFLRQQSPLPETSRQFGYVLQSLNSPLLQQSGFQLKKLAALLFVSPRTLERYFSTSLDVSPKQCLSILRFRQAVEQYLQWGYKADWETLGYHDFPHFRKDFRRQSGKLSHFYTNSFSAQA